MDLPRYYINIKNYWNDGCPEGGFMTNCTIKIFEGGGNYKLLWGFHLEMEQTEVRICFKLYFGLALRRGGLPPYCMKGGEPLQYFKFIYLKYDKQNIFCVTVNKGLATSTPFLWCSILFYSISLFLSHPL